MFAFPSTMVLSAERNFRVITQAIISDLLLLISVDSPNNWPKKQLGEQVACALSQLYIRKYKISYVRVRYDQIRLDLSRLLLAISMSVRVHATCEDLVLALYNKAIL